MPLELFARIRCLRVILRERNAGSPGGICKSLSDTVIELRAKMWEVYFYFIFSQKNGKHQNVISKLFVQANHLLLIISGHTCNRISTEKKWRSEYIFFFKWPSHTQEMDFWPQDSTF